MSERIQNVSHQEEIEYCGRKFRSRLEVQTAKTLDALGIPYQYEERKIELLEGFSGKSLYAVFANRDEQSEVPVKAYRAEYDESNGKLSFETMQTGAFVITALDFEGEEFSPEFYDEIGKTEEVQTLIRVLEEEEQNAGI